MKQAEWLKKRTFRHKQFKNISTLIELKRKKRLTVSLGLPTLNVEKTIGNILEIIKETLMEEKPLLDEIAIIDSHSKDNTARMAKEAGAKVYFDDKILPGVGNGSGKGEALWKSLHALKGDIIVWIDSDIENIHPRFVYGLLGPLLTNKNIGYVKGYYQRPIKSGGTLKEAGGGRVTEILARPIINLFYPQLSGFIQPLSGEYAGRRELLESVSFYTGYAVETGLLIEIERKFGLKSMAQVDLEKRIHTNQSTKALGKMSFAILQAVIELLEQDKKIKLSASINPLLKTIDYQRGHYIFSEREIKIIKRPPIKTVAAYRKQRKETKSAKKNSQRTTSLIKS